MTLEKIEAVRLRNMEHFGFGPTVMDRIKICPACGHGEPSENDFCQECGNPLPATTLLDFYKTLHRVCPRCDTVMGDEMLYCPQCGTELE